MRVFEFYGDAAYAGIAVLVAEKTVEEARKFLPKKGYGLTWDWTEGEQKYGLSYKGAPGIIHEYSWAE